MRRAAPAPALLSARALLAAERPVSESALPPAGRADGTPGRAVLLYPNSYAIGMSSLATHTLWRLFRDAGWEAHRACLDPGPGHSLETGEPLSAYDVIACTCSFEPDYFHLAALLEAGGVAPLRSERGPNAPLLLAGGPAVTQNPAPLAPLFDLLFLGEVEPVWPELSAALAAGPGAREAAATLPGLYRPDLPPAAPIPRQVLRNVDAFVTASRVVTPHAELSDMFLIEAGRGCPQSCKFCLARGLYHPFRPRSPEVLLAAARSALAVTPRIGLVGAALSDHPHLLDLCETLAAEGAQISTSSLRADKLPPRLLEILARSGARSVTLAPEAGTEELRAALGKRIRQEQILAAAEAAQAAGLRGIKLYFLLGVPGETSADREAVAGLIADLRQRAPRLRLEVALSPLVPKPHTPFARLELPPVAELRAREAGIRRALGRQGVRLTSGSARWALVQTALSRGGEELGPVLVAAARAGGDFSAFARALREAGLRLEDYLRPPADPPWGIVRRDGCDRDGGT